MQAADHVKLRHGFRNTRWLQQQENMLSAMV